MQFCFTAAAERALAYGSDWSGRAGGDELQAESLLLGLLVDSECRAAVMLARAGVDMTAVRQRWTSLAQWPPSTAGISRVKLLASDVQLSLRLAIDRLPFLPRPLELATEHILLGLASADHEVAIWLREQGVDPDGLQAEICTLYGYEAAAERRDPSEEAAGDLPQTSPAVALRGDDSVTPHLPNDVVSMPHDVCPATVAPHASSTAVLRVLDAAGNRAREGLRVIEDYVRFILDDCFLTNLCKHLRHDLANVLSRVPSENRLAARETQADVGTTLSTDGERRRADPADVLAANFARLQESLRSLEEFGKLGDSGNDDFKQLRYRTYTLHRAVEVTRRSIQRLASVPLCVLVDGRRSPDAFDRLVRSLVDAGAGMIQLRDKQLSDRELIARARALRAATRDTDTLCIINDRPDVAALATADGVHVGQDDASVKDARQIVGPKSLVGVSTHSLEQARQAVLDGANYIGVGPTFSSDTKAFSHFPGVELLRAVAAEIRLPAFAIGGICRENLSEVLAAGFTRVAVSGAIASTDDPGRATRDLLAGLMITDVGQKA